MRYGIRDFLFLLLLLEAPTEETVFFLGDRVAVGLHAGAVLGYQAVQLGLDLGIFYRLALLQVLDRFLLHALEGIQGAIAAHCVLDNILQLHSGGV